MEETTARGGMRAASITSARFHGLRLGLLLLELLNVPFQDVPWHLDALDVVAADEGHRVLAKSEPVGRRHHDVSQPQVHVRVRASQYAVVALPILRLHKLNYSFITQVCLPSAALCLNS